MSISSAERRVREILERRQAKLMGALRNRDGITIEKSADQMDEIHYATERNLAIRSLDRQSNLLRQVEVVFRFDAGNFGTCLGCEGTISLERLAAVPWATRCIQCQEAADREGQEPEDVSETFVNDA